jgi:hypothetical protein
MSPLAAIQGGSRLLMGSALDEQINSSLSHDRVIVLGARRKSMGGNKRTMLIGTGKKE